MGEIIDIFKGDLISVWEDDETVYISFPYATMHFPKEVWEDVVGELRMLLGSLREEQTSSIPYAQ